MEYNELLQLIDKLDQSTVAYVDFKQSDSHVVLSKEVPQTGTKEVVLPQSPETAVTPAPVAATEGASTPSELQTASLPDSATEDIVSPMIGVVYLQETPDSEPYVQVGDRINKGDVVCIVEAMKLMNEIHSPVSGIVTEILVENEAVVEYNQPLIRVK